VRQNFFTIKKLHTASKLKRGHFGYYWCLW